jgi:hypothetical protein
MTRRCVWLKDGIMKLDDLHSKLVAVARANPPSDQVPYAFEKRIMAHLRAPLPVDQWALWARALWRAAAPCVAVMVVMGVVTFVAAPAREVSTFSQELENTVMLAADPASEN